MTDTPHTRLEAVRDRVSRLTVAQVVLVIVLCSTILLGIAIAQVDGDTYTDDFEDGDATDWVNAETGIEAETSSSAIDGSTSLHVNTNMFSGPVDTATFEWESGPTLNTSEYFSASGIIRPRYESSGPESIRVGLSGQDHSQENENAFLLFDEDDTWLGTYAGDTKDDTLRSYTGTWVRFRMESDENSSELRAKVWEYGDPEPAEWQLNRSGFDAVDPGNFGVNVGYDPSIGDRTIHLDSVRIQGTAVTPPEDSEELQLDAPVLVQPGENRSYSVKHFGVDNRSQIVTNEATVTSGDPSVLTVNESSNRLEAVNGSNISQRVTVTAEYEGESTTASVAVAEPSIENFDVLPTLWRFNALMSDGTVFALILCTLFAVVGTRAATPFAGLGSFQMGVAMGWFGGWIPGGIMLVGLFATLFIGLNLTANIDYTVRR